MLYMETTLYKYQCKQLVFILITVNVFMYIAHMSPEVSNTNSSSFVSQLLSSEAASQKSNKRKKREWIIPPAKLKENTDYTKNEFIAKVRYHFIILFI